MKNGSGELRFIGYDERGVRALSPPFTAAL